MPSPQTSINRLALPPWANGSRFGSSTYLLLAPLKFPAGPSTSRAAVLHLGDAGCLELMFYHLQGGPGVTLAEGSQLAVALLCICVDVANLPLWAHQTNDTAPPTCGGGGGRKCWEFQALFVEHSCLCYSITLSFHFLLN